jgi:hypothetical protein
MILTNGGKSSEDNDGDYCDATDFPLDSYAKKAFKVRRYICRVCKIKFNTRQETQAHIKDEHRKVRAERQ